MLFDVCCLLSVFFVCWAVCVVGCLLLRVLLVVVVCCLVFLVLLVVCDLLMCFCGCLLFVRFRLCYPFFVRYVLLVGWCSLLLFVV